MRVLLLHCDYIEFEAQKKAVKQPEEITEKGGRLEDCIVCFMAVEKPDEKDPDFVVDELVTVVDKMAAQVKAGNIVVYPYAHLSSDLGSLSVARKVLDDSYEKISSKYNALKAPFGWYKSFELKCKGHPLSELSRTIVPGDGGKDEGGESQALAKEDKIDSHWHIMTPDGVLHDIEGFEYKGCENLKKFAAYEKAKSRAVEKAPPHIELMRRLELVDYEPASDPGNFRYYPKGRMIKALLEQYVTEKILDYGGVEVETPLMYDFEHPTLKKYLDRFPARQYVLESDEKRYFMRFAACFGQFLMAHDATLSYRSLPLRLYELARYAFRREKSGELTGLRRLRAFTMPDVHALCTDLVQAMKEYKRRFRLSVETLEGVGLERDDVELAVRVTRGFYDSNREFVTELVKDFGKPALIEMWDERVFYFILKYEFNFVDALDKASALSTDQIDVENGERYDIKFADKDGSLKNPIILHCSPSGAIERVIYALLEKAHMMKESGGTPVLPMWLCPTQIRVIPLSEKFIDYAVQLADRFEKERIRVDVDDRNESMGKKIRQAEREWIPYIIVVGEKEMESGKVSVRVRGEKEQNTVVAEVVAVEVKEKSKNMPYRKIPLSRLLSERPTFTG
ncbi:MAG: threonine--tRNA ligase [Candidatus Altiarchaeales archaeon]|nr:threonine--tRNA ligase [Candidatus Altiarchaeales archaeon]MBD3416292.1 threonine--tRNA ligase [Candidatus Altiarchaeales archaeon]